MPSLFRRFNRRAILTSATLSAFTIFFLWVYVSQDDIGDSTQTWIPPYTGGIPEPPAPPPGLEDVATQKPNSPPGAHEKPNTQPPVTVTPTISMIRPHLPSGKPKPATTESAPGGAASSPAVTLRQGRYEGVTLPKGNKYAKAIEAFRGIPYAQNTTGENRFRPPVALPPSERTFKAEDFGPACPAPAKDAKSEEQILYGEDCLNLNVYRPVGVALEEEEHVRKPGKTDSEPSELIRDEVTGLSKRTTKNKGLLPVVVYVHGGGFNQGVGTERNMASFISWAKEPMIGINFNYRVGALGFLSSALAAREGALNLGLRDQQMLFEWVRENIEAFGGDPERVTLMGLSAGAHSIGHHIMYYGQPSAPPAPFSKAILESGATTARSTFYPTHPRTLVQFREFLIECQLEGVPEEDVFSRLRKLPLQTIMTASRAVWKKYETDVTWPFQPVIDGPNELANSSRPETSATFVKSGGHGKEKSPRSSELTDDGLVENKAMNLRPVIPDLPIKSWRQGHFLRIPVITSFNANEGATFVPAKATSGEQFREFFQKLLPGFTDDDLDKLEELYPDPVTDDTSPYKEVPSGKGRQWARLDAAYGHYAYVCPVLQTAHFMSTAGDATLTLTRRNSTERVRDWDEDEYPQAHPQTQTKTTLEAKTKAASTKTAALDLPAASASHTLSKFSPPKGASKTSKTGPSPVYVYRYAAVAKDGVSNHGDNAPVITHDMEVLGKFPGLKATSDIIHGALVRFIASSDGDPNLKPPAAEEVDYYSDEGYASDVEHTIKWTGFLSPFDTAEELASAKSQVKPQESNKPSTLENDEFIGSAGASRLSPDKVPSITGIATIQTANPSRIDTEKLPGGVKRKRSSSSGSGSSRVESEDAKKQRLSSASKSASPKKKTGKGWTLVLGAGNDERMGKGGTQTSGTPAAAGRITDAELAACRFWWARVELSEGVGLR